MSIAVHAGNTTQFVTDLADPAMAFHRIARQLPDDAWHFPVGS
jgi:hypothetical protein